VTVVLEWSDLGSAMMGTGAALLIISAFVWAWGDDA
jgi:hypothetical protein